jgi:hypothetical protein
MSFIQRILNHGSTDDNTDAGKVERTAVCFAYEVSEPEKDPLSSKYNASITYQTIHVASTDRIALIRLMRGVVESTYKRYQDVLSGQRSAKDLMDHLAGSICSKVWEMEPNQFFEVTDDSGNHETIQSVSMTTDKKNGALYPPHPTDSPLIVNWENTTLPTLFISFEPGSEIIAVCDIDSRSQKFSGSVFRLRRYDTWSSASEAYAGMSGEPTLFFN